MKQTVIAMLLLACLGLEGCGMAAAPCRVSSALIKAAGPTDSCAGALDPDNS